MHLETCTRKTARGALREQEFTDRTAFYVDEVIEMSLGLSI